MTANTPSKRSDLNRPTGKHDDGPSVDEEDSHGLSDGDLEAIEDRLKRWSGR
jgi:hypothetical protein